jgi:hypothetical protein
MLEHPKPPDQEPSCRCGCQLLRSDIHTLFDLGKIGIHPDTRRVVISEALRGTVYEKLENKKFKPPEHPTDRPNSEVLRLHLKEWDLGK